MRSVPAVKPVVAPVPPTPEAPPRPVRNYRPGAIFALLLLCVYGGLALAVDFPRAAFGIQSDEATYYMMGYSLALDGDLTYRREDLSARLARVSERPHRCLSQERARHHSSGG